MSRHGPKISNLFFADDLILFCKAGRDQVVLVNEILNTFCRFFGQKSNKNKTQAFLSHNTLEELANEICGILRISRVEDLGKIPQYAHLSQKSHIRDFWFFFVDKVCSKLNGQEAMNLSMVGRIMLDKSDLLSIPIYYMATTQISRSTCNEIEKLARSFICDQKGI